MKNLFRTFLGAACAACITGAAHGGEVEVLHFWTSPGEAKSIAELKAMIGVRGHTWKDFAVVGGGGGNAMSALRTRVLSGNPPASASIKGPAVQEWAELNAFANLDAMATFDRWDSFLPKVVQDQVKHKGRYVAVPVNVHRVNWLWSNSEVLLKSGVARPPATFDEFLAAADKIKAAGFIPVAHGGQPWQDFILFEAVVLGTLGTDFYKRAFVKLEPGALAGPDMRKAFETYRRLKAFTDEGSKGRAWDATTDMVIKGRAAFQFMGDWAKGEFLVAGKQPGKDFTCTAAPGTADAFTFVVDTFAMFQLKNLEAQKAQGYLAYVLLSKEFQENFNLRKGSIPARSDVSLDKFDLCGKESGKALTASDRTDKLVPSAAVDMAMATETKSAMQGVISDYWNSDTMTSAEAVNRLALAAQPKAKEKALPSSAERRVRRESAERR
jgi:glucose/mannose transport system substrate-binding protein